MTFNSVLSLPEEFFLQSLPSELMLQCLMPELQKLIFDYLHKWEKVSYWKHRFTQDVLTCINQGHRLSSKTTILGVVIYCPNCYAYGHGETCLNCEGEFTYEDLVYMSYAQFCNECYSPFRWTYEAFSYAQACWFGLQRIRAHNRDGGRPDPLMLDIHQTQVYCNLMQRQMLFEEEEILISITTLFD